MYPFLDDSPLYLFFSSQSPRQLIWYVMLSLVQFPVPPDVHTKQSSLPQCCGLKGFETCSFCLSVIPVRSTTFILNPQLAISCWYIFFSLPFGVNGTKRTESNPPSLYHVSLFCRFSCSLSRRLHVFGRLTGRIPSSLFCLISL